MKDKLLPSLIALCLTLGLAPFFPEPHLLGKIRWIAGGGTGMQPMDYFDTILHGAPWVGLILWMMVKFTKRKKEAE